MEEQTTTPGPAPPEEGDGPGRGRRNTMNTTTSPSRAIVLGGGGSAGIAWESGLLAGLLEAGADLEAADLVVGTSAGSAVAVQLRAGGLRLDALRAEMGHEADDGQSAPDDAAPAFDAEPVSYTHLRAHET